MVKKRCKMYSTHNEEKSVDLLKNKIDKFMILISKNVYIDKLGEIVKQTAIHTVKLLK